jgi:ComF family protein
VNGSERNDKGGMGVFAFASPIIDFALPPRCPGCGVIVGDDHRFCTTCWRSMSFLTGEGCASCNTPMADGSLICAPCLAHPPDHDGVRAAVAYGDVSRAIVLKLKHGRRPGVARAIGRYLGRHMQGLDGAIIAPVPLHRWRLWSRGYNQSLLIARQLPLGAAHELVVDLLERTRATPILRGLGKAERAKAVRGAFRLKSKHAALVKGRTICLVDDVFTSGATVNACAKALKKAGAAHVVALCWARVLDQDTLQH